jgi:regulation of enolase protein 1 (concanavalin A-like superfamily)
LIKFCFEKIIQSKKVVSVVTKDISDDCNSVEIISNKVYYKMAKAENVITLYYSADNKNGCWYAIFNLTIQKTSKLILAQSPTGNNAK